MSNKDKLGQFDDYHTLFHMIGFPVTVVRADGMFMEYNKAFEELLGYHDGIPRAQFHPGVVSPEFQPNGMRSMDRSQKLIAKAFKQGRHSFEWMHKSMSGREFLSRVTLEPIHFKGEPAVFASIEDVSEHKKLERLVAERTEKLNVLVKELERQAKTDPLTGLFNRIKLDEMLAVEHQTLAQDMTPYSIALIDIDHFKLINDQYGHYVGDDVLKKIAEVLLDHFDDGQSVGRWGGEEFLVILPNTQQSDAAQCIENLRAKIEVCRFSGIERLTISAGIAQAQSDETIKTLFNRVDTALYAAKEQGRNRVEQT